MSLLLLFFTAGEGGGEEPEDITVSVTAMATTRVELMAGTVTRIGLAATPKTTVTLIVERVQAE